VSGWAITRWRFTPWPAPPASHSPNPTEALAEALHEHVLQYGLPDHTRELSWLIIGLLEADASRYEHTVSDATQKLMAGQHRDRELAGLWGQVCVDPDRLRLGFEIDRELSDALDKAGGPDAENPTAVQALQAKRELSHVMLNRVARECLWDIVEPDAPRLRLLSREEKPDDQDAVIAAIVPGLAYNPLKDPQADLLSTALAVRALHAVKRAELWPATLAPLQYLPQLRPKERPTPSGQERCQEPFLSSWASFLGLPRGRKVDSRPNCLLILSRQAGSPKGWPRLTARRRASNSASDCGALTRASQ